MSVTSEFSEYFSWAFEGSLCAVKQRKGSKEWFLDLPHGQSVRLSAAALASLKTNLRRLPNSALRGGGGSMPRAGLPWTNEEEQRMTTDFRSTVPIEVIASRLGRSRLAVELHLEKLGLMPARAATASFEDSG